jgi:hypothetical protein
LSVIAVFSHFPFSLADLAFYLWVLLRKLWLAQTSECFLLYSSWIICTKNAYEDILTFRFLRLLLVMFSCFPSESYKAFQCPLSSHLLWHCVYPRCFYTDTLCGMAKPRELTYLLIHIPVIFMMRIFKIYHFCKPQVYMFLLHIVITLYVRSVSHTHPNCVFQSMSNCLLKSPNNQNSILLLWTWLSFTFYI